MKKRVLILFLSILALMLCITACTDTQDDVSSVKSIEIVSGTVVTECVVGDTLDFSGIKVKVTFEDGTTKVVGYSDVTISAVDTSTAGEKTVTVKYGALAVDFKITVKAQEEAATLSSIKIVPGSVATTVLLSKPYDLSALQIEATYSDGSKKLVPNDSAEITTVDTSTAGEKTFTVSYQGKTDSLKVTVLDITEMNVVSGTVANKLFVGETLDTSKLQLLVTYSDESSVVVDAAQLTIGSIDTTTHGEKKLEITYCGAKLEYTVLVVGEQAIIVDRESVAQSVKVFGTLDTSKISAELIYTDGEKKELTAADLTVTNIDTSAAGKQTLKVTYKALEDTLEITVVGVESITVVDKTIAKEILKGNAFDDSNISVNVKYTDGTTEFKSKADLTLGSIDVNKAGAQELAITYLDKTVNYTVKVCHVVGIRVEGVNTVVQAGEEIDLQNMKVYGVYNDSHATEVLLTQGITTNKDSIDINSEQDKLLEVAYNGELGVFHTTVKISAEPPELIGIEITVWDKFIGIGDDYAENEQDIIVYAIYGNETRVKITSGLTIGSVKTDVAGEATLTVSYTEDGITAEATEVVTVLPIASLEVSGGIDNLVDKNGTLDTSKVDVLVTFSNGTETLTRRVGVADGVTVSAPDTTTGGDKTLTVSYLGSSTTFAYHVRTVSQIEIFSGLSSTLRKGYAVNTKNIKIKVTYSKGPSEYVMLSDLKGAAVSGTEANATTFTVTYEGCSASKTLTLISIKSVSGLNNTIPAVLFQGSTFDIEAQAKLSVTYNNGEVYLVGADDPYLKIIYPANFTATPGTVAIRYEYTAEKMVVTNMITGKDEELPYTSQVNVLIKGIDKISIEGGILTTVNLNKNVDTSGILVKVEYNDGSYQYVSGTNPDGTINTDLKFSKVDTTTSGKKTLTVSYYGKEAYIEITVEEVTTGGFIFGALLPDDLVKRDSYKKNFYEKENPYIVGDDNPYYFYLNVIELDDNDNIVDKDGRGIPTVLTLTEIGKNGERTLLEGDARNAVVAFDSDTNSYDFTEAAIGRTFELKIYPRECADYEDDDLAAVTQSHTVKIVDGYNVYEAWELNMMTNGSDDIDGTKNETKLTQYKLVDEYLKNYHGAKRPDKLAALVFHANLNVTEEDIPPEYFCTYEYNGVTQKNLHDHMGVFERVLSLENPTFAIYGNYYNVYSYQLPEVAHKGYGNNDNEFSSLALIMVTGGNIDNEYYRNNKLVPFVGEKDSYTFNIQDVSFRDNDPNSNDQSASERHIRGSQALFVGRSIANVTNVNVDAFMISLNTEGCNSIVNLKHVKFFNAWQGHIFAWANNYYQQNYQEVPGEDYDGEGQETWSEVRNVVINIEESFLAKCGGPVILAQSDKRQNACNNNVGIDVIVDDKSELYSYVTGQEAWFVALGVTPMASSISALDPVLEDTASLAGIHASFTSDKFITGVRTMNLVMVNMGTGADTMGNGEEYTGSFKENGVLGLNMTASQNKIKPKNTLVDTYIATTKALNKGKAAPVFQTSGGGIAFCDPSKGCLGIDFSTGKTGAPSDEFFQGKYITLYMNGMGIMLEYYNPTNPEPAN